MKKTLLFIPFISLILFGCTETEVASPPIEDEPAVVQTEQNADSKADSSENASSSENVETKTKDVMAEANKEEVPSKNVVENEVVETTENTNISFDGYKVIQLDACSSSGYRQANVVVDIGYGDREYWAFTNEHGQLVRVVAKEIVLQNDSNEKVTSSGRYCNDEAKVSGVESDHLDEGHIIADSLGGVSNAYNITPQNSTLNRHGDQAYMEETIRSAGGATDFEAIITYTDTKTQIPSHYEYTYTVRGNKITDSFDNINPDEVNENLGLTNTNSTVPTTNNVTTKGGDVSSVDVNGNGQVTIKEAKDAGFKMPITKDHWLYQYMDDRDGDGMVGE